MGERQYYCITEDNGQGNSYYIMVDHDAHVCSKVVSLEGTPGFSFKYSTPQLKCYGAFLERKNKRLLFLEVCLSDTRRVMFRKPRDVSYRKLSEAEGADLEARARAFETQEQNA
ncbi:hypothetical protein KY311_02075 [Candidatus Woesearchaeota archaeon]|nr:hypothetical protein [Candidatus Woesearchaeota archaeon]